MKDGALGRVWDNPQPSIVGFDDRPADRQAHSHPIRFCREERVEYPIDVVRANSCPSISNRYPYIAVGMHAGFHGQDSRSALPQPWHRWHLRSGLQAPAVAGFDSPLLVAGIHPVWLRPISGVSSNPLVPGRGFPVMTSLRSTEALVRSSFLKLVRTLSITDPARWPSATMCLSASFASFTAGIERLRKRKPASALVIIADNGCLTSWAIVAATASPVMSRASRSRFWARIALTSLE